MEQHADVNDLYAPSALDPEPKAQTCDADVGLRSDFMTTVLGSSWSCAGDSELIVERRGALSASSDLPEDQKSRSKGTNTKALMRQGIPEK
eukprot:4844539-Amphidinium_carterae.1